MPAKATMPASVHAAQDPVPAEGPSSFEAAYHDHAQRVARWAWHLAGAEIDVEDVVQEVFLVVSRRLASFRGDARFTSWLFEITRRIVANHRRRHRWRFWRSADKDELASIPSLIRDPLAELERSQANVLFYRTLDKLSEKYRTVLVLYELEGISTQEIAELCGSNLSTVKVRLHRARSLFLGRYRQLLKKETP